MQNNLEKNIGLREIKSLRSNLMIAIADKYSTDTKVSTSFLKPDLQPPIQTTMEDFDKLQYGGIQPSSMGFFQHFPPSYMYQSNMFGMHQVSMAEQLQMNSIDPSNMFRSLPLREIAAEGMRMVCSIDMLLLKNYYPLKEQIFNKSNQTAVKRLDNNENNVDWLKSRFNYRYKSKIAQALDKLVDDVNSFINSKQEDEQVVKVDNFIFGSGDFLYLDKEMKSKCQEREVSAYLEPQELVRTLAKYIEMYLQGQPIQMQ